MHSLRLDPLRRHRLPGVALPRTALSRNPLPGNRLGRQRLPRRSLPLGGKILRGSKVHGGTGPPGDRLTDNGLPGGGLTRDRLPNSRLPYALLLPRTDLTRHTYGNTLPLLNRLPRGNLRRNPLLPLPGRPLRRNHRTGLPLPLHPDAGLN